MDEAKRWICNFSSPNNGFSCPNKILNIVVVVVVIKKQQTNKQTKTVEHDDDTQYSWNTWNGPQRSGKKDWRNQKSEEGSRPFEPKYY